MSVETFTFVLPHWAIDSDLANIYFNENNTSISAPQYLYPNSACALLTVTPSTILECIWICKTENFLSFINPTFRSWHKTVNFLGFCLNIFCSTLSVFESTWIEHRWDQITQHMHVQLTVCKLIKDFQTFKKNPHMSCGGLPDDRPRHSTSQTV